MAMDGDTWAKQMFAAIPGTDKLQPEEQDKTLNGLKAHYQASVAYLKLAVQVQPTALVVPAGALVVTAGSPSAQTGSVTTPTNVTGAGTIT